MPKNSAGVLDAIRVLEAEEARFAQELEALKRQGLSIAVDLKRVRTSLAALTGEGGTAKVGLSDAEAIRVVVDDLATGPLTAEALKTKLLSHAQASGLSGTGVHLVLRRVLKDQRFEEAEGGYRLRDSRAAAT